MGETYDVIVIGAGPGGYTAALKAAEFGLKTAVVEERKLGGACVNRGCIPTKALLYASSCFGKMQRCDELGVSADFISFDFKKMGQYKDRAVKTYRNEIGRLFREKGIAYFEGHGRLRAGRRVEVRGPIGETALSGRHVILAAGARAVIPEIPGIDLPGVYTSTSLLEAKTWNFDRLTIVGGGVIGVEFATIFNNLCSKVTLIEKGPHLLGPMDEAVARRLEESLKKKGISVQCGASVSRIEDRDGLICTLLGEDGRESTFRSGPVLMAVGRRPDLEDLWGEDVFLEKNGDRLMVDPEFRTSEPEVYAIGDMAAEIQLAHVAAAQGTYVVEKIAGRPHSIRLEVVPAGMFESLPIVPNCIYTEPEIATVGITEETARARGIRVKCGHYSMTENGRSIITGRGDGFIRLVFEAYSNAIVGAQIVCPRATDMIGEMATAIANGLTAGQLSLAMRAHPTYSEGISAAIADAMSQRQGDQKL